MARELHDHAGQTLVALGMNLSALRMAAENQSPKIVALAAESHQLSDDLSKEIRTLSYLLHPPLLDEVGLSSALGWYLDGFSERSKIPVELQLPEDLGRLPKELELVIFRVIQEESSPTSIATLAVRPRRYAWFAPKVLSSLKSVTAARVLLRENSRR